MIRHSVGDLSIKGWLKCIIRSVWEKRQRMWQGNGKYSREEQDVFALQSQQKYFEAKNENRWKDEIIRR